MIETPMDILKEFPVRKTRKQKMLFRESIQSYAEKLGYQVFYGDHQLGTVSFVPKGDCEELAEYLASRGICVRAGLHCAPFAHESAGTLQTGTVRISFGWNKSPCWN